MNATEVDGLIVAGSVDGSGLVMNVFGASGSLDGIGDDVDRLLETTRHAGG